MIYLDNAATSFPKPPEVAAAISDFLTDKAGNPGRSGHGLALAAQGVVSDTRRALASFLGAGDPARLAFTLNATDALNLALWGLLRPGDRVVTTSMEHNAVARPLFALAESGVAVHRIPCARDGSLDLADLECELRSMPTRLVAMTHASNVCGTVLPIAEAAELAHRHGALILVDAAQTAGVLPVDVTARGIDLLAVPGHKGLLGPTGTGALYVAPGLELTPTRQGGTGSRSEELRQPRQMPDRLEAGTVNTVGIAGLGAALRLLRNGGAAEVRAHEEALTARLLDGLRDIPGVHVQGTGDASRQVAVVSVTVDGWEPVDLGAALDSSFKIAVRAGLHCAPLAHHSIGTYPQGTVRLAPGPTTTPSEIDETLAALRELALAAG
ncbi:aminotransferase class V-fold PLP-dependent enzyme [Streptomyces cavernae]|uniref:aminotransferase class V-fold PLP-dependent enzyme n=1 Tax=Streptomyces cavernae TaxID=2259034 RepID=UPI000FEB7620|nr:aminotransferase class V-fold PLP-dependent enzyme [Streptomyces cavernae]